MNLKQEFYSESYKPKQGEYAYYVNDTNASVMRHILHDFLIDKRVEARQYNDAMTAFNHYLIKCPILMYFIGNGVLFSANPEDSYAVENHYTILNVQTAPNPMILE